MRDRRMIVNPNPRRGIEVRDGEAIKARINEINNLKRKWLAQEQRRRPEAMISCTLISLNLDDLWRDHDVVDLESFERVAPYL
tara:strand:- start:5005 stop:5253 length:249 start_codon:yes stop_codon:yes gene_type:complete